MKKTVITPVIIIATVFVFFIYKNNVKFFSSAKIDSGFIENISSQFNLTVGNSIFIILDKEYLNCGVCRENFCNLFKIVEANKKFSHLHLIIEKPIGKKWTEKRIKFWLSKMGVDVKINIDTTKIINTYLPNKPSFVLFTNEEGEITQSVKMPVKFDELKIFNSSTPNVLE